MQQCEIHSFAS